MVLLEHCHIPNLRTELRIYPKALGQLNHRRLISYVSCHDDHCIGDRLRITDPEADAKQRMRLLKLAGNSSPLRHRECLSFLQVMN